MDPHRKPTGPVAKRPPRSATSGRGVVVDLAARGRGRTEARKLGRRWELVEGALAEALSWCQAGLVGSVPADEAVCAAHHALGHAVIALCSEGGLG